MSQNTFYLIKLKQTKTNPAQIPKDLQYPNKIILKRVEIFSIKSTIHNRPFWRLTFIFPIVQELESTGPGSVAYVWGREAAGRVRQARGQEPQDGGQARGQQGKDGGKEEDRRALQVRARLHPGIYTFKYTRPPSYLWTFFLSLGGIKKIYLWLYLLYFVELIAYEICIKIIFFHQSIRKGFKNALSNLDFLLYLIFVSAK